MKKINAYTMFLGALLAGMTAFAQTPTDIFLLIGQSNMAGRGPLTDDNRIDMTRIVAYNKTYGWIDAVEPLHHDKSDAGAGLGASFARTLADADPDKVIGLVPAAVGGSVLNSWQPGMANYNNAVSMTKAAIAAGGTLRGILWHQGESDSTGDLAPTYAARLKVMVDSLREDLNAQDLPFIAGELAGYLLPGSTAARVVNEQLHLATTTIPNMRVVTVSDITSHKGDGLHMSTPALRTVGVRYAAAYEDWMLESAAFGLNTSANVFDAHVARYVSWPADASYAVGGAWDAETVALASVPAPSVLEVAAGDASLDFVAETQAEVCEVPLRLVTDVDCSPTRPADFLPVEPGWKCGVCVGIDDAYNLSFYGLAKVGSQNAWVKLDGPVPTGERAHVVVTLTKVGDVVQAVYNIDGTDYTYAGSAQVEVVVDGFVSGAKVYGTAALYQLAADGGLPRKPMTMQVVGAKGPADGREYACSLVAIDPASGYTAKWYDGSDYTLDAAPTHTAEGDYLDVVKVTATGYLDFYGTGVVNVLRYDPAGVYVASAGNDDTGDGSSTVPYATIAKGIAEAKAAGGGTVYVGAGTYEEHDLVLDAAVEIVGLDTTCDGVVIDAKQLGRAVTLSAEGAALRNLTVQNGQITSGTGANVNMSAGVISNCVIKNGTVNLSNGQGGNIYMTGGVVEDSEIVGGSGNGSNSADGFSTYATGGCIRRCEIRDAAYGGITSVAVCLSGAVTLENSLVTGCNVSANSGSVLKLANASAKVVNCTIVGNTTAKYGVRVENGFVYNTVIFGNGGTAEMEWGDANGAKFVNCAFAANIAPATGTACIDTVTDAAFTDFASGDYTPAAGGALVDMGDDASYPSDCSPTDLAGNDRFVNEVIDIGAYELQPTPEPDPTDMTVSVTDWKGTYDGAAHSATVTVMVPTEGYTITWDDDKTTGETGPAYTDAGFYTNAFTVTADGYLDFVGTGVVEIAAAPEPPAVPQWVMLLTEKATGDTSTKGEEIENYTAYYCTVEAAKQIFGSSEVEAVTQYLKENYETGAGSVASAGFLLDADEYGANQYGFSKYFMAVPFSQYLGFVFYDNGEADEFRVFGADNLAEDDNWLVFDDEESGTVGDWTKPTGPGVPVGDNLTATCENGVCTISGTGAMWDVSKLDALQGLAITNLVVGEGVTTISAKAFLGMLSIHNVSIGSTVSNIGLQAFDQCYNLTNVVIRTGETPTTVSNYAFYRCYSLVRITVTGASSVNWGEKSFTLQAGIYMNSETGLPEIYPIPEIVDANGSASVLYGTDDLGGEWRKITSDADRANYHFFKIVIEKK